MITRLTSDEKPWPAIWFTGSNADDSNRISVDAHGEVAEAIAQHQASICTETLAVELRRESAPATK